MLIRLVYSEKFNRMSNSDDDDPILAGRIIFKKNAQNHDDDAMIQTLHLDQKKITDSFGFIV